MTGNDSSKELTHNSNPRILVAVLDAVAPNIDLTCANHMIFLKPALFPSKEVRIAKQMHRATQTRRCFMYRPVIEGLSVEDIARSRRQRKKWLDRLQAIPKLAGEQNV